MPGGRGSRPATKSRSKRRHNPPHHIHSRRQVSRTPTTPRPPSKKPLYRSIQPQISLPVQAPNPESIQHLLSFAQTLLANVPAYDPTSPTFQPTGRVKGAPSRISKQLATLQKSRQRQKPHRPKNHESSSSSASLQALLSFLQPISIPPPQALESSTSTNHNTIPEQSEQHSVLVPSRSLSSPKPDQTSQTSSPDVSLSSSHPNRPQIHRRRTGTTAASATRIFSALNNARKISHYTTALHSHIQNVQNNPTGSNSPSKLVESSLISTRSLQHSRLRASVASRRFINSAPSRRISYNGHNPFDDYESSPESPDTPQSRQNRRVFSKSQRRKMRPDGPTHDPKPAAGAWDDMFADENEQNDENSTNKDGNSSDNSGDKQQPKKKRSTIYVQGQNLDHILQPELTGSSRSPDTQRAAKNEQISAFEQRLSKIIAVDEHSQILENITKSLRKTNLHHRPKEKIDDDLEFHDKNSPEGNVYQAMGQMEDEDLRLIYGNRVNTTQYMTSHTQSEVPYITHKDDFFEGINPRTDYRPSEDALRYTIKLREIQQEQRALAARDPLFKAPTLKELLVQKQIRLPSSWVDDEFSSAATTQIYNNIIAYETYLATLQPQFIPTCDVYAMHTMLTHDQRHHHQHNPEPTEPPSIYSPQSTLPNVFSPLDIRYRPLFADFLIAMRYQIKIQNHIAFRSEKQREEERRIYEKHSFKIEFHAYKALYQQKLHEQITRQPTRAFLWDLNEFTLQLSYNELMKQKLTIIQKHNNEQKLLKEPIIEQYDTERIDALLATNDDYMTSFRLFRTYRSHFEKSEEIIQASAIGHKHTIIRGQAEFNQYLQWFSEYPNYNPYTKFGKLQSQQRAASLQMYQRRFAIAQDDAAAAAAAATAGSGNSKENIIDATIVKTKRELEHEHQIAIIENLHRLPGRDDEVVQRKMRAKISPEDEALLILRDTSMPKILRQQMYLDRLEEIRQEKEEKARMKKQRRDKTNIFDKLFNREQAAHKNNDDTNTSNKEDGSTSHRKTLFHPDDNDDNENSSDDDESDMEPVLDDDGQVVKETAVYDDFFPGLREFVALDIAMKANNLYSFPAVLMERVNADYLKQYQYLAQQATKDNGDAAIDLAQNSTVSSGVTGESKRNRQDEARYGEDDVEVSQQWERQKAAAAGGETDDASPDPRATERGVQTNDIHLNAYPSYQEEMERNKKKPNDDDDDAPGGGQSESKSAPEDQRLTQRLYQDVSFNDDFVSGVRQRLQFELNERARLVQHSFEKQRRRKYESQLLRYVQSKFPNLVDPEAIQQKVEEEKHFDTAQTNIFQSTDRQLAQLLKLDIDRRQLQTDQAKKIQLQKLLALTHKEVANLNKREDVIMSEASQQKDIFLSRLEQIYRYNLDRLYNNLVVRDEYEKQHIVEQFNSKMLPFIKRYDELQKRLFDIEKEVLTKHHKRQTFQQLYQKDANVDFDHDPLMQSLNHYMAEDMDKAYTQLYKPELDVESTADLSVLEASQKRTKSYDKMFAEDIPLAEDPKNAPLKRTPTQSVQQMLDEKNKAAENKDASFHSLSDTINQGEREAGLDGNIVTVSSGTATFKDVTIAAQDDFRELPEEYRAGLLKDDRGMPHANQAMQTLYRLRGIPYTKLHAYYAFLGYDPSTKSIDDILFHMSQLFGEETLARATEFSRLLATDEVVVKMNALRPKSELFNKLSALEKEARELDAIREGMNPELFQREGQRLDGFSFTINTLPYVNYRARFLEVEDLLGKKRQEILALRQYIKEEGLEAIPLANPAFEDFRTLFDAFSLAEKRKVRTFMHPYRRDGIFEVLPLTTDLPRRRVAFALDQSDLPAEYKLQDLVRYETDWDDLVHARDKLLLDVRATTATMKELEAQLRHYVTAVVVPALEHYVDVFLSSSTTQSNMLSKIIDASGEQLDAKLLRDYREQQYVDILRQHDTTIQQAAARGDTASLSSTTHEQFNVQNNQHDEQQIQGTESWRTDNTLHTLQWQVGQDQGIAPRGFTYDTDPIQHHDITTQAQDGVLPVAKKPDVFRRFSFAQIFLPKQLQTRFLTQQEQYEAEIKEEKSHRWNIFKQWDILQSPVRQPNDYKNVAEQEFDHYLRIQQRLYTQQDKLDALKQKDFVIQNAQSMRKVLLELDHELEENYVEIRKTLPDEFQFSYSPLDIDLTYSKLELMLDVARIRRNRGSEPGLTPWIEEPRSIEEQTRKRHLLSQGQIDRLMQDPFLGIDLTNDTITKYISLGKVISEQEEKSRIRKDLLQDQHILNELNRNADVTEAQIEASMQTPLETLYNATLHEHDDPNSPTARQSKELLQREAIQANMKRNKLLLQQQELLEQQQLHILQQRNQEITSRAQQNHDFEQQMKALQREDEHVQRILIQKFPQIPIQQVLQRYTERLNDMTKELKDMSPETVKNYTIDMIQNITSNLYTFRRIEHDPDVHKIIMHQAKQSDVDQNTLHKLQTFLTQTFSKSSSPSSSSDHTYTIDPMFQLYLQMLQQTRHQLDLFYASSFPHLSKLERLRLLPITVPERVHVKIPRTDELLSKIAEEQQLVLHQYLQQRNKAMTLVQHRLEGLLPRHRSVVEVRLQLLNSPDFISHNQLPTDPTPEMEQLIAHFQQIPAEINHLERRIQALEHSPAYLTYKHRLDIIRQTLSQKYDPSSDDFANKMATVQLEMKSLEPPEVAEMRTLPQQLAQLREDVNPNSRLQQKIRRLAQERREFQQALKSYQNQEDYRIEQEALASQYQALVSMITNEYILQLNLVFEQSLLQKDKAFLQQYQSARDDYTTMIDVLTQNIEKVRGLYDKIDILSKTASWCVDKAPSSGPKVIKFLKHPDVKAEHDALEMRRLRLGNIKRVVVHSRQQTADKNAEFPYIQPLTKKSTDTLTAPTTTTTTSSLSTDGVLKTSQVTDFSLTAQDLSLPGDNESDAEYDVLLHDSEQSSSLTTSFPTITKSSRARRSTHTPATQPENEEQELVTFSLSSFDIELLDKLQSNASIQYVEDEPPKNSHGEPLAYVILPQSVPTENGISRDESLYVQLKRHNQVARVINAEVEVIANDPSNEGRDALWYGRIYYNNSEQLKNNPIQSPPTPKPSAMDILTDLFRKPDSQQQQQQQQKQPPSKYDDILRRVTVFTPDELRFAKYLDRIESCANTFVEFHAKFCYPDAISSRRRVFDPKTNTAYLITNPHINDNKQNKNGTDQENAQVHSPSTQLFDVLTGESKVFTDLVTVALVDLETQANIQNHQQNEKSKLLELFRFVQARQLNLSEREALLEQTVDEQVMSEVESARKEIEQQLQSDLLSNQQHAESRRQAKKAAILAGEDDASDEESNADLPLNGATSLSFEKQLKYINEVLDSWKQDRRDELTVIAKEELASLRKQRQEELAQVKQLAEKWLGTTDIAAIVASAQQEERQNVNPYGNDVDSTVHNLTPNQLTQATRYRRTSFDPKQHEVIEAKFFNWRGMLDDLNLKLMSDIETLRYKQYQVDLYNAQCEEAIQMYRSLTLYPHLRDAYVTEVTNQALDEANQNGNVHSQNPLNQQLVVASQNQPPSSQPQLQHQSQQNVSSSPSWNYSIHSNQSNSSQEPAEQFIATNHRHINQQTQSYNLSHNTNNITEAVVISDTTHADNNYPSFVPQSTSLSQSTTPSHVQPDSVPTTTPISFQTAIVRFFTQFRHSLMHPSVPPPSPSERAAHPLSSSTSPPLLMTTEKTGHSWKSHIFQPSDGHSEHRSDAHETGVDLINPALKPHKVLPEPHELYKGGFKQYRKWLKTSQDNWDEYQPERVSTFRDYMSYVIQSRRWNRTTLYQGLQLYRDQLAAKREAEIHRQLQQRLHSDLDKLRAQQGGLDSILEYNHRLQFKRQREVQEALLDRNKQEFVQKPLAIHGDLSQIDERTALIQRPKFVPQHEMDAQRIEDQEVLLYSQHLASLTPEEKQQMVDQLLQEELHQTAINESYYKDWQAFPSLPNYKAMYEKYYGIDSKTNSSSHNDHLQSLVQKMMRETLITYDNNANPIAKYFSTQLDQVDTIFKQYQERERLKRQFKELTEQEYRMQVEEIIRNKKIDQDAANLYFLQQQNAQFLHTPIGVEIYQKRQNRRIETPEKVIENEQEKLRWRREHQFAEGTHESNEHSPEVFNDHTPIESDRIQNQLVDQGKRYFEQFDVDALGYPARPRSFTDFVDIRARMRLGTTFYGSVIQTPAAHQYHDSLDPSPLPPEAPPPHFRNYNTMHPDRLGYFITYYDAYRMKHPPESPFRQYNIERPNFFQYLSVYPTYTLDGNYVHTPTLDPFEWAKDPSRPNLLGTKTGKMKLYYLYWGLYGFFRPTVWLYTFTAMTAISWIFTRLRNQNDPNAELISSAMDYSLALNTYVPTLPF